jgi:hypothetical protein
VKLVSVAEVWWGALALVAMVAVFVAVGRGDAAFVLGASVGTFGMFCSIQFGAAAKKRTERDRP